MTVEVCRHCGHALVWRHGTWEHALEGECWDPAPLTEEDVHEWDNEEDDSEPFGVPTLGNTINRVE